MNELEEFKKELEETLEKVNEKLEEDEENEETYYTIDYDGKILRDTDCGIYVDILKKEIGNYFRTKKEASGHLEDLKIKAEIKKIAKELNGDKKIDWGDGTQPKYFLIYNYDYSELRDDYQYTLKSKDTIYCLNENFADECIKRIGKERLENYLKRN